MPVGHNHTGRSKRRTQPFVMLHWYMIDCAAWADLSPADRAVYLQLARAFNGYNNGRIALSVRQAGELCRINKDTAAKSLKRLEEHGFIECVTKGGFTCKVRHAAEWRLTAYPCDATGQPASKRFMRWGR